MIASEIIDSLAKEEIGVKLQMIICSNLENRVLSTNTIKPHPFLGTKHFCRKKEKRKCFNVSWCFRYSHKMFTCIYNERTSMRDEVFFFLKNVLRTLVKLN